MTSKFGWACCLPLATGEVSYKLLIPWAIFSENYHALTDLWVACQSRLNLTEFDPESSHFDLVISSTEKFNAAITTPSSKVAGSIESSTSA
jgi:hypothetical protein